MSDNSEFGLGDYVEIHPMYFFRWEESQQSHILLYPEGIVKLNQTAGEILGLCTGEKSVREMIEELKARYTEGDVTSGVLKFLEVSHAKGWIKRKS
jgi:pyrroloquinoline quinone biosynthesis protein D